MIRIIMVILSVVRVEILRKMFMVIFSDFLLKKFHLKDVLWISLNDYAMVGMLNIFFESSMNLSLKKSSFNIQECYKV